MQLRGAEASELTFGLPEQLVEKRVRCDLQHKPLALLHLVKGCGEGWSKDDMKKVLCFTNSKDSTHRYYSETSDKGHSERGQTSEQRTNQKYPSIYTPYKITSERVQPPKDKMLGPKCVHYSEVSLYNYSTL